MNKSIITQGGDGTAIPAGCVGERRNFTFRVVAAVTANWVANVNALDSLPIGRWAVYAKAIVSTVSVTSLNALISTNTASDATGDIGSTSVTAATFSGFATIPLFVEVIDVTSTTSIYAKANTSGASANVTISGYAIRIA